VNIRAIESLMKIDAVKATYYLGPKLMYGSSFHTASPMCVVVCVSDQHTVLLRSKAVFCLWESTKFRYACIVKPRGI
jgi:hypothetical protein